MAIDIAIDFVIAIAIVIVIVIAIHVSRPTHTLDSARLIQCLAVVAPVQQLSSTEGGSWAAAGQQLCSS